MSQNGPDAVFREGLDMGEIRVQSCGACGRSVFFPRTLCPHCKGEDLTWQPVEGPCEIHTTTTVRRKPERGGDYNVCMVELPGGARMMSRVEGIAPDVVRIGMHVDLFVGEIDGRPAVLCKPAGS